MSQENIEVVRAIYESWLNGESARELIDSEIEYVNPPDAVETGVRRGREAFRGIGDAYEEIRIEPLRYMDAGDDVVVIARVTGRGRGSGIDIDWRHGYIWTIRNGKGVRFRWFNKPDEALEAAGLQE